MCSSNDGFLWFRKFVNALPILPADRINNVVSLAEEVQLWSINHGHEFNRWNLCFISSSTDSKATWTYQEPQTEQPYTARLIIPPSNV